MMLELMRVSDLIRDLPIDFPAGVDFEVTGVTHDSRRVEDGDLFIALVGDRFDGRTFLAQARERGACAVLSLGESPASYDGPWLRTDEPREVMGLLAARVHEHPDRQLLMVGITGTNGKSTLAALVVSMLESAGRRVGTAGTLGHRFGDVELSSERTTPEATDLFRFLAQVREAGGNAVAMEVSSIALAVGRVRGVGFDVAVFTNLSRDHLDFHADFEDYFAAKRRLFDQLKKSGQAVVNVDDSYGRRLADELVSGAHALVTFGGEGQVSIRSAQLSLEGIRAIFDTPRGELAVSSQLRGRFNLENLLAAVACGEALGLQTGAVVQGLERQGPVTGRLEPVDRGQPFPVFVDYAHSDAALSACLRSLREIAEGRKIVCVFGCGGDRDAGKRELMGRVAGELADLPIVTSDNPRTEAPLAIIAAVEEGVRESGNKNYEVVPNRAEAIARAVESADAGWIVLVAGKGHEERLIVDGEVRPFSDRRQIESALEAALG